MEGEPIPLATLRTGHKLAVEAHPKNWRVQSCCSYQLSKQGGSNASYANHNQKMTNELSKSPLSPGNGSEFAETKLILNYCGIVSFSVTSITNIKGDVLHAKA